MRISRIFRKYSRVLLLVFMSLLLVVFLVGDVIGRATRGRAMRDIEIGQAFGEPVFLTQAQRAEDDFTITSQLMLPTPPVVSENEHERNVAMYLAMEEARRAGVVVGRERIAEALSRSPRSAQVLEIIRRRRGCSLNSIYDAAARVVATSLLAQYQLGALATASLPEIEQAYRDQNQEARVLISVIDANAFLADIPEPSEEELQAHFEECKDRTADHTDEARVCGYQIANRVQIEYLTVDPDAIKEDVRVSAREAERYYDENKQKYMKAVDDSAPFMLDDSGEPQMLQMTYDEVREQVREDCRAAKAIDVAQRLVNEIQDEAERPWSTAPLDENNVRQVPAAEALVSFEELKERFSSEYPVSYKKTELVTARELGRERGFARASKTIDRRPVRAATLAFRVEGLVEPDPNDPTPILRVNEPSPVMLETRTIDRNAGPIPYQAYVFRVVDIAPQGPPASLDDVREKAVRDLKQIKALELAGEQARLLAEQAGKAGLTEAVAAADELKRLLGQKDVADEDAEAEAESTTKPARPDPSERYLRAVEPFEPEQFRRQARSLKNVGYAPGLHEQVFAAPDQGGPDPTREHPVIVVPLARSLKWAVVELLEVKPLYEGEFELKRAELESQAYMRRLQTFQSDWFKPKNIIARTGYVPRDVSKQ